MRTAGLTASLRLPDGRLDLEVTPGAARRLPDDDRVVAALAGTDGRRGHRIHLDGRPLHRRRPAKRVRAGLVTVGEAPVAAEVPVRDHLAVRGGSDVDRLLAEVPRLAGRGDDPAGVLSGGERRLLAWARALMFAPRAVVLDRAATGLDADAFVWATGRILAWREAGVALLVRVGRDQEATWVATRPGPSGG